MQIKYMKSILWELLYDRARKKTKRETKREMDGLRPKGYAGTADHPGGCPG